MIFEVMDGYDLTLTIFVISSLAGMGSVMLLDSLEKLLIPDWELEPTPIDPQYKSRPQSYSHRHNGTPVCLIYS